MAAWKSGWGSSRRGGGAVPVPIPVPNPIPGAPILPRAQNNLVCLFFFFSTVTFQRQLGPAASPSHRISGFEGPPDSSLPPLIPQPSFPRMLPIPPCPLSSLLIFPRRSQEGNTFLIFFRRVVRPCCPSPPAPALLFSGASLHLSPETLQANISLLEGKGKSPRRG